MPVVLLKKSTYTNFMQKMLDYATFELFKKTQLRRVNCEQMDVSLGPLPAPHNIAPPTQELTK